MVFDEKALEDMMLTSLVISNRVWRFSTGQGSPEEMERMVSEKVQAATDGYWALANGLMSGDKQSWEDPATKFAEPGRETLRKNAKRLAGYRG